MLALFSALIFTSEGALSQELLAIRATPREVGIGQPVVIEFDFKPQINNSFCGLLVNFGDGTTEYVRIEQEKLPISLTRQYAAAGPIVIQADGKTQFQGLRSLFSCQGSAKSVAITVLPDDYAAQRAAAQAAGKASLQRAEIDRRAADTAARSANAQRQAVEQSAKRAAAERQAADQQARKNEAQRAVASPAPPTTAAPQQQAAPIAAPAAPAVTPPKPAAKPKSALDL